MSGPYLRKYIARSCERQEPHRLDQSPLGLACPLGEATTSAIDVLQAGCMLVLM